MYSVNHNKFYQARQQVLYVSVVLTMYVARDDGIRVSVFNETLWFDPNTTLRSSLSVYLGISEYLIVSLKLIKCKSKCILAGIIRGLEL